VVPKEFALKVSRRLPGKHLKWIDYPDLLTLSTEARNVSAKKAPDELRMFFLPSENTDEMVTSPSKVRQNSASPSRRNSKS